MRKLLGLLTLATLTVSAHSAAWAAYKNASFSKRIVVTAPKGPNTSGTIQYIQAGNRTRAVLTRFKEQNRLSSAMNQKIRSAALRVPANSYVNGTIDTIPYFSSWFITGSRNSVYPYTMAGHSPAQGGTTSIANRILPLEVVLTDSNGNVLYDFNPLAATDPQGNDIDLIAQSPLYDATTTYPGPPSDTGQMVDTLQRVEFRKTRTANWHTLLAQPQYTNSYVTVLDPSAWSYFVFDNVLGVVVDINVMNTVFENMLQFENSSVGLPNTVVPIIVTDYLQLYDPVAQFIALGFHTAQPGLADPNGILVWTWGTFVPQNPDNGFTSFFGDCCTDMSTLTHEVSELFNDPFVNTYVSAWVDGSVSFAQGNLEVGDAIELMTVPDAEYFTPLNTVGGQYIYNLQNEATLEWFTRNPFNHGIYSWPNENTLGQSPHPVGCRTPPPSCWSYGEGSASFYFGPPF